MSSLTKGLDIGRLAAVLLFAAIVSVGAPAQGQYAEYDVKAGFIFNFAQFVKWPAKAFPDANGPFVIGILGEDPFGGALDKAVQGQSVGGRRLEIKRSSNVDSLGNCQMIFVTKVEKSRYGEIISSLQGKSVLTVGETDQFIRQGGMIGLSLDGDKVRFEINASAAQRAGLEISSRLMRLSK